MMNEIHLSIAIMILLLFGLTSMVGSCVEETKYSRVQTDQVESN
jgi:hypothetical protein